MEFEYLRLELGIKCLQVLEDRGRGSGLVILGMALSFCPLIGKAIEHSQNNFMIFNSLPFVPLPYIL